MLAGFKSYVNYGIEKVSQTVHNLESSSETNLQTDEDNSEIVKNSETPAETSGADIAPTDDKSTAKPPLETLSKLGTDILQFAWSSAESVTQKAREFNYKTVIENAPLLRELNEANDDFARNRQAGSFLSEKSLSEIAAQDVALPWHPDYSGTTNPTTAENIQKQVLGLSSEARNLLSNPPEGDVAGTTVFEWTETRSARFLPVALRMLREDAKLAEMRFKLVPERISEEKFWRNYFYRVTVIVQSETLAEMANAPLEESIKSDDDSAVCINKEELITDAQLEEELSRELASLDADTLSTEKSDNDNEVESVEGNP